jgi:hypothetical protein
MISELCGVLGSILALALSGRGGGGGEVVEVATSMGGGGSEGPNNDCIIWACVVSSRLILQPLVVLGSGGGRH